MSERRRELTFGGVVVAALLLGVVMDVTSATVALQERRPPQPSGLVARAAFCPGAPVQGSSVRLAAASPGETAVSMRVEASPADPSTAERGSPDAVTVEPGGAALFDSGGGRPVNLVAYGGRIGAGALVSTGKPVRGAVAVPCGSEAGRTWYFAAGSAALGFQEQILLYNPFPDEAVVKLTFFTPKGIETRTSFDEVPVPAGAYELVDVTEVVRVRGVIATGIEAKRGRVVAWKNVFARPEDRPPGVQASLGAPGPAERWYFPDGALGPGGDEAIAILNPSGKEAVVGITLAMSDRVLQPRKLMEVTIPRRSARSIPLEDFVRTPKDFVAAAATVVSLNQVAIVAERTLYFEGAYRGSSSEVGASEPSERWIVPPGMSEPVADAVAILNPGTDNVTVDVTLMQADGDPLVPDELQGLELEPGTRLKLPIGSFTSGRPMIALVDASGPVVAERFAYSSAQGDVASVMGIPVGPAP